MKITDKLYGALFVALCVLFSIGLCMGVAAWKGAQECEHYGVERDLPTRWDASHACPVATIDGEGDSVWLSRRAFESVIWKNKGLTP